MHANIDNLGGRHSSVVSSASTILLPRVQIPSTLSMLISICVIEIYQENNENKQKEAGIGQFKKHLQFEHGEWWLPTSEDMGSSSTISNLDH